MKKTLFTVFMFCTAFRLFAQPAFLTMDSVDINKINARVLVHGDMWWDPTLEVADCQFPSGSGKSIAFVGSLWMSGYDAGGQLHTAAQTYRQNGNDYWPGPLDATDTLTYATSQKWACIWKVNRADINYFLSLPTHDSASTPPVILNWPGAGNTYARGNGGALLSFIPGYTYAPFVDVNGDGIYEPLLGDYPDVPGDQALWYVFSDNGPTHSETNGKPLGIEVQTLAFAYNRGTLIDNVIYYNYRIINRGANTYTNFRIGQFADLDLGYYMDDYIGFDSSHRMGVNYNGNNDDGGIAGSPLNSYGYQIPIAGVTMIKCPGDAGTNYVPAGNFDYYNNDNSIIGNPFNDSQYNYYLRSQIKTGEHFTNDFAGAGIPSTGYGTGPNTNYVYPGDPADSTQWSECVSGNPPGDRRFIVTTNDFTLYPGAINDLVFALVTTDPDSLNGCPSAGFAGIKTVADTAWGDYYNPPAPLPTAVSNVSLNNTINIYPNPAHDRLYIECTGQQNGDAVISIYNTLGQLINVAVTTNGHTSTADIGQLPAGVYYVQYRNGNEQKNAKFIKD